MVLGQFFDIKGGDLVKPRKSVEKRRKAKRHILRPARMRWRNYLKGVCRAHNTTTA